MLFCTVQPLTGTASDNKSIAKLTLTHGTKTNRPCAPARQTNNIECEYSVGQMTFTFPLGVSYMNIIICDNGTFVWNGMVSQYSPSVNIPILNGEYEVICITDENKEYSGIVYFGDKK